MSTGPGLFSDIGKKAKDLLTRDYLSDHKVSISTTSQSGLSLTNSTVKRGGYSCSDISALYVYKNTIADVKVDTESNITTTLIASDIIPSSKTFAILKYPDIKTSKLEVQYYHPHASFSVASGLETHPLVDGSVTLGTPSFAFGVEAGYDTALGELMKYNAGISITKPDACASIILGDKGDMVKVSYIHYMDGLKKSAGVAEISRKFSREENTITVGASYVIDPLTIAKVKLNNYGMLSTVLQHEVIKKSLVTISSEFNTKALDRTPKFGVSLALKP